MKKRHWLTGLAFVLLAGIGTYALYGALSQAQPNSVSVSVSHDTNTLATSAGQKLHMKHTVVTPVPAAVKTTQKPVIASEEKGVYYRNRVVIVTYHDISPTAQSAWTITPELFSAQLDKLQQGHFHVINNNQFAHFMNHSGTVPTNAVLLTFDDGYQDMYTYALPILRKHHMTGVFFTIVGNSDNLEQNSPSTTGKPAMYMSWQQLAALSQSGNAIESHTYQSHYQVMLNHKAVPVFNTPIMVHGVLETNAQYIARITNDFAKAKQELQTRLGQPVTEFAWPYGSGTRTSLTAAESVGYDYIFTTTPGCVSSSTWSLDIPRIDIGKPWMTPNAAVQLVTQTGTGGNLLRS